MRSVADSAGDFSDSHLQRGGAEPADVALIFRKPVGYFQSKSDRLRMHAVSSSNLRRVAKLVRAQIQHFAEQYKPPLDEVRSIANLQRLRGIYDIVRS